MTIHAVDKNMSVGNVVIQYRDRPQGSESKLNTVSDGIKVLKTIARLFKSYKPFQFFGIISILLLIIALAFFIPILVTYSKTGLVPKIPTLLSCGFLSVVAIQTFFSGTILQSLRQKEKQDFEMNLNNVYFKMQQLLKK